MVPSDVLGVGVRDADEFRLNDSGDVLDRVLGPDAHEVDRDLDDAPEEEDAETGVRRDFDSPVEALAHDGAEVLPVGVVKIEDACRRLDGGDDDSEVVLGHRGEVEVG